MFASVGRRLAILNAAVVLGILALVSIAMFLFLQRSLQEEVDQALEDRAAAAQVTWAPLFRDAVAPNTVASLYSDDEPDSEEEQADDSHDEDDDDDEAAENFVQSGDTIAYALDGDGNVLANSRGISMAGLPFLDAMPAALGGKHSFDDVMIEGETVRILTEPAIIDGRIVGAIQVAQGQDAYEAALRVVRIATLGGLALGAVVAIPAGLFLAHRSMRPIRRAFAQQQAFVADASHELRTPLTVLRVQAEYLQRGKDVTVDDLDQGHQVIIAEVDTMNRLVNDMLLLARAEHASLVLEPARHDLTEVVQQTLASFSLSAEQAGVTLVPPDRRSIHATFDASRIQQVVRILVENAIAHTPASGVVTVSIEDRGSGISVVVSDTGKGIAPADLPHVFDRFYRSQESHGKGGGMGLGLAIAKTLVELHGGEISAVSEPGTGSVFTFRIPR